MSDPFGVSKSFIGTGFKPASKLSAVERDMVRARTQVKPRSMQEYSMNKEGMHIPGRQLRGPLKQTSAGRKIHEDAGETRSQGKKISTRLFALQHAEDGHGVALAHAQPNGKGGGVLNINPDLPKDLAQHAYKHELQHLKPKRNPHRFLERYSTSHVSRGREEGRADFLATGKKTPGQYPGNSEFQHGYNSVQDNMARAKKNPKRKFRVNSQGVTTIGKSAFGISHGFGSQR